MCKAAVSPVRLQAYPGQEDPDVLPVCRCEGRSQSDVDTMSGKGKGLRKILKFPVMGTGVRDKGAPRLFFPFGYIGKGRKMWVCMGLSGNL